MGTVKTWLLCSCGISSNVLLRWFLLPGLPRFTGSAGCPGPWALVTSPLPLCPQSLCWVEPWTLGLPCWALFILSASPTLVLVTSIELLISFVWRPPTLTGTQGVKSGEKWLGSHTADRNGDYCKLLWQAPWQYVPRTLNMSTLCPYLLEISVEIFMNEKIWCLGFVSTQSSGWE
jgi:hypothetical protein